MKLTVFHKFGLWFLSAWWYMFVAEFTSKIIPRSSLNELLQRKRGWIKIRSSSSAIYFVFMVLSLVTPTCSISFSEAFCTCSTACTVTPGGNTKDALLSCLPPLDTGSWGYNKAECCFATLTSCNSKERWRVCRSLQTWPYSSVRARGAGSGVRWLWSV